MSSGIFIFPFFSCRMVEQNTKCYDQGRRNHLVLPEKSWWKKKKTLYHFSKQSEGLQFDTSWARTESPVELQMEKKKSTLEITLLYWTFKNIIKFIAHSAILLRRKYNFSEDYYSALYSFSSTIIHLLTERVHTILCGIYCKVGIYKEAKIRYSKWRLHSHILCKSWLYHSDQYNQELLGCSLYLWNCTDLYWPYQKHSPSTKLMLLWAAKALKGNSFMFNFVLMCSNFCLQEWNTTLLCKQEHN